MILIGRTHTIHKDLSCREMFARRNGKSSERVALSSWKKKKKGKDGDPPLPSNRIVTSSCVRGHADGETSCYSISMQRAFNEEARRLSRHAGQTLLDYGNRSVLRNPMARANFDNETSNKLFTLKSIRSFRNRNTRRHSWSWYLRLDDYDALSINAARDILA